MKKRVADNREVEDKIAGWLDSAMYGLILVTSSTIIDSFGYSALGIVLCIISVVWIAIFVVLLSSYLQRRKARRLARDGESDAR